MMIRLIKVSACASFLLTSTLAIGCKDKPSTTPAPSGSATASVSSAAPAPTAATPQTIPLADGESLAPAGDLELEGTNPRVWQPTAGDAVALGFVFKGELVRAVAVAGGAPIELGRIEINNAYSGQYGTAVTADNKVVLVLSSSGGSDDPGFTAAWRIGWDAAAKKPVVEEKGNWSGDDSSRMPAWAHLTPPTAQPSARSDRTIRADGVGAIKIGMSKADAIKVSGLAAEESFVGDEEGNEHPIITLSEGGKLVMSLDVNDGKVSGIDVMGGAYLTPEGVHLGMKAAEVTALYKKQAGKLTEIRVPFTAEGPV